MLPALEEKEDNGNFFQAKKRLKEEDMSWIKWVTLPCSDGMGRKLPLEYRQGR